MYRLLLISICIAYPVLILGREAADGAQLASVDRVGNYRTREDRREAGLGTEITEWLTFSGLVEVETIREVKAFDNTLSDHYDFTTDPAVQAAFDVSLFDIFEAELIFEYSEDPRDPLMDELIVATDVGNWGLSVGRYYVPFGLYYSHFVNGPLLEFAETRSDTFQLDYDFNDIVEVSAYVFDGQTRELGSSSKDDGWGLSIDALLLSGRLNIGGGFLSNLAESDEEFLREEFNNTFEKKVGAWNAYLVYEADSWDISMEVLKATEPFREFDPTEDKPEAWNLEMAYFPTNNLEFAIRYERSKELIDEAEEQYGLAVTWRLLNNVSTTIEYLRSDYKRGFVEEDDDVFVTKGNTLALWFAFEF